MLNLTNLPYITYAVGSMILDENFYITADAEQNCTITYENEHSFSEKDIVATHERVLKLINDAKDKQKQLYDKYAPIDLVGIDLSKLTAVQLRNIQIFELYIGQKIKITPTMTIATLPSVNTAPIVMPFTLSINDIWFTVSDNSIAYTQFLTQ